MVHDGCNDFSLWAIFYPLQPPPPNSLKNQNLRKMKKKHLEISSFYTSVPKVMIICYNAVLFLRYGM